MFRTPIGFHDAYVAAPSQKAALAAWGTDGNLFAQGVAEEVTEPALMKAPLARPGEVIRVSRGSAAEQMRALDRTRRKDMPRARSGGKADDPPAPPPKARGKKPGRTAIERAERGLAALRARQDKQIEALRAEEQQLAEKRRKLEARLARERRAAEDTLERAREDYRRAMAAWADD